MLGSEEKIGSRIYLYNGVIGGNFLAAIPTSKSLLARSPEYHAAQARLANKVSASILIPYAQQHFQTIRPLATNLLAPRNNRSARVESSRSYFHSQLLTMRETSPRGQLISPSERFFPAAPPCSVRGAAPINRCLAISHRLCHKHGRTRYDSACIAVHFYSSLYRKTGSLSRNRPR